LKIALGADHAGYLLKEAVKEFLSEKEIEFKDFGTFKMDSCDYPEYAFKAGQAVIAGEADLGILVCGTGIGMSISANKIKGIRAAVVHNEQTAQLSRLHNDANILCLGARILENDTAVKIIETWLNTSFEGGRHQKRLNLIFKLTGL
jgi:ribose 5-phosphate isomerase B